VTGNETTRRAPVPLSTLELQKRGTQYLRRSGDDIMTAAEGLYHKGLISYPRTETDQFDPAQDTEARARARAVWLMLQLADL
jgi:DNA topoisomerase III